MTGTEFEKNSGEEIVSVPEIENEVPLVVRPKVRTRIQVMTGARPKTKIKVIPGIWFESMSLTKQDSQTNAIVCPVINTDSELTAKSTCFFMDRELVSIDNDSFPRKVYSQVEFHPSFGSGNMTDTETWSFPKPLSKQDPSHNSMNSWFWSEEEVSVEFHPKNRVKADATYRHIPKLQATDYFRQKNKQDLCVVSSRFGFSDESVQTSWLCAKSHTNFLSRPREEVSSKFWFSPKRQDNVEFNSGFECENAVRSWFWDREQTKYRTITRARKETSERAQHSHKQDAYIDVVCEPTDVIKKESWFCPEESGDTFLRCNTKKETKVQTMEKEEARTRVKLEERSQKKAFIGTCFWTTEESTLMNLDNSPPLEDESIVGSWFWNEEVVSVETPLHSSKSRPVVEVVNNSCLEAGEKTSMEFGAEVTSQSVPVANDEEIIVGSWFWAGEVNPKSKEEAILGSCFCNTDEASVESGVEVSYESRLKSEEEIISPCLWTGEASIDARFEKENSQGSEEETIFLSWFWSENQTHMDSLMEASCGVPQADEEEGAQFESWFWARVDPCEEAIVANKSSLGHEDASVPTLFVAREEASMKFGFCARCKFMAKAEYTNNKSCFWEEEPCLYHANRGNWKVRSEEEEDTADSKFWCRKFTQPEALVGSLLWAMEECSTDYESRQKAVLPTEEKNMTKSQFWKQNKDSITEATDTKESRPEDEDIIDSWFWPEEQDRLEAQTEGKEEGSLRVEEKEESLLGSWGKQKAISESRFCSTYSSRADVEEIIVGSWFWEQETSLETVPADIFESKTGTEEEEVTVGSWFWPKEANREAESQTVDETRSKNEETSLGSCCYSRKEVSIKAEMCCVSEQAYDEEMIVESWFWFKEKAIKEVETIATCESRSQNDKGEVVESWSRATGEINKQTDDGNICESKISLEEEEEDIVGSWFWVGDEAYFESNPCPVYRATCEVWGSFKEEIESACRPQSWEEVTGFKPSPWGRVGFPSQSPFRFPGEAALLFCEMFEEDRHVEPESEEQECLLIEPSFSLRYDLSYQSIQEIRKHLRAKMSAEPESWFCSCIRCELRIDSEEFEEFLLLIEKIQDPFIDEICKIVMGKRSASQFTLDFIRESGVVSLIETLLNYPSSRVKTRFLKDMILTAPSYPNLNMIQTFVCQVCEETLAYCVDSPEQLYGLRIIRYLTTATEYHTLVANYMSGFLALLVTGNIKTRFRVLEMLLNLSENFVMTKELLSNEAVSVFMGLFDREETNGNIETVVEIFENIGSNIRIEIEFPDDDFSLEHLIPAFHEIKKLAKQLQSKLDSQNNPEPDQENYSD